MMNLVAASTLIFLAIIVASSVDHVKFIISNSSSSSSTSSNNNKGDSEVIIPVEGGAFGPESFAFDGNGDGPYSGVSDGRIIKWLANQSRWVDFAFTSPAERHGCEGWADGCREHICGRPLGLSFNGKTGDLYTADAYMGLLVVGPDGGLASPVATHAHGVPFGFTNALDIDPRTGAVYFTDSSTRFQRRNHVSVILSGDSTGRLLKFDPSSKQVSVVLDNLMFPNGVALSEDGDFILVAETTTCRILKVWLQTSKAGNVEVVAELPGFPDNIKRNQRGEFWVGINSRRSPLLKWAISNPWMQNLWVKLPFDITKAHSHIASLIGKGMGIRLSRDGYNILEMTEENWRCVSEVEEKDGNLWVGSVKLPFAIKVKINY